MPLGPSYTANATADRLQKREELLSHPLEEEFNLSASELLDMIDERFRLKVALAGAVAEVQCEKRLVALREGGSISRYERHDVDNYPDFTIGPSEKGDLVLDPFAGSNTTGAVAEGLGRRWIGVEMLREYAEDSELRFPELSTSTEEAEAGAAEDGTLQSKLL